MAYKGQNKNGRAISIEVLKAESLNYRERILSLPNYCEVQQSPVGIMNKKIVFSKVFNS